MSSFALTPLTTKTKRTWNALFAGALAFAAIVGPGAAHAGWRFTQWGMSAAEVKAASPVPLIDGEYQGRIVLRMAGPHDVNGVIFKDVTFILSGDKLERVSLNDAKWSQVDNLSQALRVTFGPPVSSNVDSQHTKLVFNDPVKGNRVELFCWQYEDCRVTYTPLAEGF